MIRIFKWCIVRHDDWKEMNRANGMYEHLLDCRDTEIKELRERLDKIERGECYEGEYCEACKHANVVRTQEQAVYGGTYSTCRTNCLLNVPCAKFERND